MKNKLYKLNNQIISTPSSELGTFICNTADIIPTKEADNMILFEITDNTNTEFITASQASVALQVFFEMYKPITSYATVVCFVDDVKTI